MKGAGPYFQSNVIVIKKGKAFPFETYGAQRVLEG
jgi:hypothetical protein